MTRTVRAKVLVGGSLVALFIGATSLAWACTRTPSLTVTPGFGRAGSQVQVTGKSFTPAEPVEVRWNSTGGPVLGRGTPGADFSFSVAVTIPEKAAGGVYYIVATAPNTRAQASFEVRTAAAAAADPSTAPENQTSASGSGAETTSSNGGQTSASTSGGNATAAGAGEQSGDLGFADQPQTSPDASVTAAPAAQTASAPARSAGAAPAGSAQPRPAGTPAPDAKATTASPASPALDPNAAASTPALDDETASLTPRSATADLWSGFNAGDAGSLAPGLEGPAPASDATTPLAVGVGLLSAGLVAMGLGFGAAEVRRKRALAGHGA